MAKGGQSWRGRKGSTTERGYGWAWQQQRERILERDKHLCQPCLRKGKPVVARQVDHIVNKARGGTDEDANLQAICKPCHDEKSAEERGFKSTKPQVGDDGWPI